MECGDKGLVSNIWTGKVNWAHRKGVENRFRQKMSSAFDLWSWIKVSLGQPRGVSRGLWGGHLGLRRGSGQGEL